MLSVAVSDAAGTPLSGFQVVADPGGDAWIAVDCTDGGVRATGSACDAGRAAVPTTRADAVGLTVKAPGHRTVRTSLVPSWTVEYDPGAQAGCGGRVFRADASVVLEALPAFEATADYRTGFDAQGGLDAFVAQAYSAADDMGPAYVVKFFLEGLPDQPTAWFQDTRKHPLHYDFVHTVLKRPVSLEEFERATYHGTDRAQMAGSLIWRPELHATLSGTEATGVMTIEYFPTDDLTPDQAARAFLALQERLEFLPFSAPGGRLAYLPPGSVQESQAQEAARDLAAAGVTWTPRSTLYAGVTQQRLNAGVAYGTLRKMTPEELENAAVSYMDIILLTRLPNDLPLVGGTITEELQTPLAHVNVAARARGTPNLALPGASTDPRVAPFLGRRVRFEVTRSEFTIAEATAGEVDTFWEERLDRTPMVPAFDDETTGLIPFSDAGFEDFATTGVKAANLAELSRLLPGIAPDGFAVPFHYYRSFTEAARVTTLECQGARDDCLANGRDAAVCGKVLAFCNGAASGGTGTIQDLIDRLLIDGEVATDSVLRDAVLAAMRWMFCHIPPDPSLAEAIDDRVRQQFGTQKVRLRSSSNAEDLPDFSGAGLYTSVGAAVDGKNPPSVRLCEVWASLWNWKAYEERSFWKVDHSAVRMGVGVHNAFPDEKANGVLITQNVADPFSVGMYVNVQKGEVSVTNPEGDETPEVFTIVPGPTGVQVARQRYSSLSPTMPLLRDDEVLALYLAASRVQSHFAPLYKVPEYNLALDIEFKFHGPKRDLILKQVRPYRR